MISAVFCPSATTRWGALLKVTSDTAVIQRQRIMCRFRQRRSGKSIPSANNDFLNSGIIMTFMIISIVNENHSNAGSYTERHNPCQYGRRCG